MSPSNVAAEHGVTPMSSTIPCGPYPLEIEVDGNVSRDNIPRKIAAGANVHVAGSSSLFDGAGRAANIRRLRTLLDRAA